jgi:hypothetical protein
MGSHIPFGGGGSEFDDINLYNVVICTLTQ